MIALDGNRNFFSFMYDIIMSNIEITNITKKICNIRILVSLFKVPMIARTPRNRIIKSLFLSFNNLFKNCIDYK